MVFESTLPPFPRSSVRCACVAPRASTTMTSAHIDTHAAQLSHEALGPTARYSSPDIVIKAKGPSFSVPSSDAPVGFSNITSIIDGKMDSAAHKIQDHIGQLGGYSRYANDMASHQF